MTFAKPSPVPSRRVRLTRKLALMLNGIDVSGLNVGDVMELPASAAEMMIAERWAEPVNEPSIAQVLLRDRQHNARAELNARPP